MQIDIATGHGVKSTIWKNKQITWENLCDKLSKTTHTQETLKEFLSASKEDQLKIKDVGGYVGGYLRNGRRNPKNVVHRQLITLDLDFAPLDFWDLYTLIFDNAAIVHATHKHSDENPRFRLVLPLSREVTGDEYQAISRLLADDLGIEYFDNTTFEINRLMFWPSTPKDQEYYYRTQTGLPIDADEFLNRYADWTDSSLWPSNKQEFEEIKSKVGKQQDPEEKRGLIGAFCRSYNIHEVIEKFLSDQYLKVDENRYTYTKGSTAGGLITYDDKFAYSHHGTDPISGHLCNAYDLVRMHKFGQLGDKSTPEMDSFILKQDEVKTTIARENINAAKFDFDIINDPEDIDLEWAKELEADNRGKYVSTASNINLVLANDHRLKGLFKQNIFDNKKYVTGNLPWRIVNEPEPVKNVDFSGVRNYIETVYGIASTLKVEDSLNLEFEKNNFHPVKDYLNGLKWDRVGRVDNLLIDYFGADDNVYTNEAIRKMLVGAVARIFEPGCKFDLVLTLVSEEGTGKSTFIKKLGKSWFSDTFITVQGKEALEQIQGCWLVEMAELAGLRKAEVESIKHFLTKQEDTFRPAYGRVSETYKRQCVFFGTTNNPTFLKDQTGNRRFMPIDVRKDLIMKDVFSVEFDNDIDQIWAEAVHLYKAGETLFLSREANKIANVERRGHIENDERAGIIEDYLDRKLQENWNGLSIDARRMLLVQDEPKEGDQREFVCIAEIWVECLGRERYEVSRYNTRDINEIMRSLEGWEPSKSTKNFGIYGKQKFYRRIKT